MPRRDASAYAWDVLDACRTIERGLAGCTREENIADQMRRLAIERLLITIGEAVGRMAECDASMAAELGDVTGIVSFRNILVHGYFKVDHERVWDILASDLPKLRGATEAVWSRFAPYHQEP